MSKTYDEAVSLLKSDEYKYDFHLKDGNGKSQIDAFEFEEIVYNCFVEIEYKIINFIGIQTLKNLFVKRQDLKMDKDKYYDILLIEETNEKGETTEFKIFFDITDCFKKKYNRT
ncbi:MAG: hypothetical protein NTZ33_05155 [Bacteroidetes bacterium]|nr:hypothetical protein [Bacteroidota bacterium]